MAVKVVTDSSSDIPPDVAAELDITIVPLYIRFGEESYRDGIDISADDFYKQLTSSRVSPKTSTPSPGDYTRIYNELAENADSIVSIHLSPRYSSALNAALLASEYVSKNCEITVIDSRSVSMGCGLAVMAAARAARARAGTAEVISTAEDTLERTHIAGMIADIRYVMRGHRLMLPGMHLLLGKLGTLFRLKLVGEIYEAGKVWGRGMYFSRDKALARLQKCVTDFRAVSEIAVLHAMEPEWARDIAERLEQVYPQAKIYVSRLSGATGIHGGPRAMAIAFTMEKNSGLQ